MLAIVAAARWVRFSNARMRLARWVVTPTDPKCAVTVGPYEALSAGPQAYALVDRVMVDLVVSALNPITSVSAQICSA